MNCLEVEKYLDDFFDRSLSRQSRRQISAHLKSCQPCALKFKEYEKMIISIQSLEPKKCPNEVVESVYEILNFDKKAEQKRSVFDQVNEIIFLYWRQMGIVSAAIMVFFFLYFLHAKMNQPPPIAQSYSTQEVEQATDQVKLALAYLNQVTSRTEEILEKQVFPQDVIKPMKSSLKNALKPLINGG